MKIDVVDVKSKKAICVLDDIKSTNTIGQIKRLIELKKSSYYVSRQSLRMEPRGKNLSDDETISSLNLPSDTAQLFLRDLGPQIGWKTVFLVEYFGPFAIYPIFYMRPELIYGDNASNAMASVVHLALWCWSGHYAKRLLETLLVHRFSHATMPILNIFKNSSYYWGFAVFVAYFVNHPLYTSPSFGVVQIGLGLGLFVIGELGNLSIHLHFRSLRPAGTKKRAIPVPGSNPFTQLFNFVSCPNYTYEVVSWLGFSIMTQSLPALLFTIAGGVQMTIWALGKHRNYKREFQNYPRGRKAIIPFVI